MAWGTRWASSRVGEEVGGGSSGGSVSGVRLNGVGGGCCRHSRKPWSKFINADNQHLVAPEVRGWEFGNGVCGGQARGGGGDVRHGGAGVCFLARGMLWVGTLEGLMQRMWL